jgi:superfamily II DNA/RNA helicase
MQFKDLNLNSGTLKAIEEMGYNTPTPVQEKTIPLIMNGNDILASARTGTGKTASFLLPLIDKIVSGPRSGKFPQVLVLVPTRELAQQVAQEAYKFSKYHSKLKTVCVYGGDPIPVQRRQLSKPYEILVATPGRLLDHMQRGRIDFSGLAALVLDEADRMLDMGFMDDIEAIVNELPTDRQTIFFSATLNKRVFDISKKLLKNPQEIIINSNPNESTQIKQSLYLADNIDHKYKLLNHLLQDPSLNQAVIFTSTKSQAEVLEEKLSEELEHKVVALHGDMSQRERTRNMQKLRNGQVKLLVSTDVAARGIDVNTITHVFNFDLPHTADDYWHRIGRTGRAGQSGEAHSFMSFRDKDLVKQLESRSGERFMFSTIPGLEPQKKLNDSGSKPKSRSFKDKKFGQKKKFFKKPFGKNA